MSRRVTAGAVAGALWLAGCGASGTNAAGGLAPVVRACDEGALAGVSFAVEAVPAADAGSWVRQEGAISFAGCTATLSLAARVVVDGQILDEEGRYPVAARILATRPSAIPGRPPVVTQTETNLSGAFSLSLEPGEHQLRILPAGTATAAYPPVSLPLSVKAGADAASPVVLRLARGIEVRGAVRSALALGLAGATVRAVDPATGDVLSSVATTDATGFFSLRLGAEASQLKAVRVVADGGSLPLSLAREVPSAMLPLGISDLELRAPAVPQAQRFVVPVVGRAPSGAMVPAEGARVDVTTQLAGDATSTATFSATGLTDADGHAAVMLLPGGDGNRGYQVTVTPPADSLFARGTFALPVGGKGGVLSALVLEARPSLAGRVVGPDGQAAVSVSVALSPAMNAGTELAFAPPQALTGGDGRFVLHVERGSYDINLVPPATLPLPRWTVEGREVTDDAMLGDLALPPGVIKRLRVVGPSGEPAIGMAVRLYALGGGNGGCQEVACATTAQLRAEGTTGESGTLELLLPAR